MNEETLHLLAEKARPYLKDLPPADLLGLHPEEVWEGVEERVQGFVRSFSPGDYRVAVRPGLPPDEAERVALHELIHNEDDTGLDDWLQARERMDREGVFPWPFRGPYRVLGEVHLPQEELPGLWAKEGFYGQG